MIEMAIKKASIIPYEYWGMESGFKTKKVFIIKGEESPDPAKMMLWGRDCDGNVISDFKRGFERKGRPIEVTFKTKGLTAHQEKEDMIKAIDKKIKGICLVDNNDIECD